MLTVHKNTAKQRRANKVREELIKEAKYIAKLEDISGFAIVAWNEDCTGLCHWKSTKPVMPGLVVPEFVKRILLREMQNDDTNLIIEERVFK